MNAWQDVGPDAVARRRRASRPTAVVVIVGCRFVRFLVLCRAHARPLFSDKLVKNYIEIRLLV